jgi:hypothetical protein
MMGRGRGADEGACLKTMGLKPATKRTEKRTGQNYGFQIGLSLECFFTKFLGDDDH